MKCAKRHSRRIGCREREAAREVTQMSGSNNKGRRRWPAVAAACAVLASGSIAAGQEQTSPEETIFARKILMDSIGHNMDEIEAIAAAAKVDLAEGRDHADTVSVMLMVFPHLFPPSTNQWKPTGDKDPGTDTFSSPEIWTKFADFYSRSKDASQLAFKASRAEKDDEFKGAVAQLRTTCDSCHALYMKPQ
jgi:cytochrome c556